MLLHDLRRLATLKQPAVCSCEPDCQFYAVDMAFCGGEGLVTGKSNATFIMICQQATCTALNA